MVASTRITLRASGLVGYCTWWRLESCERPTLLFVPLEVIAGALVFGRGAVDAIVGSHCRPELTGSHLAALTIRPKTRQERVIASFIGCTSLGYLDLIGSPFCGLFRISQLPLSGQIKAIGRLEEKLSAPPKTTKAPDPIDTLKTGANSAVKKSANEMSMDEYAAYRKSRAN